MFITICIQILALMGNEQVCITGEQESELVAELERRLPQGKLDFTPEKGQFYDVVLFSPAFNPEDTSLLKPEGRGLIIGRTSPEGIYHCKKILNEMGYKIEHSEVRREIGQSDRWICILFH